MEVTAKDKKHIDEQVRKMDLRMKMEATEYAQLCEKYYYERLRERIDAQISALEEYPDCAKRVYNK